MNRSIRLFTAVPKTKKSQVTRGFATQKERKLLLDTFDQVVKQYAWVNDANTNLSKKLEEKYGSEAAAKMKADFEAKAVNKFNSNLAH